MFAPSKESKARANGKNKWGRSKIFCQAQSQHRRKVTLTPISHNFSFLTMISIDGVVSPVGTGTGSAHRNLITQLPAIAAEFPEVANAHLGTINLELQVPVIVLAPDHRTLPIQWKPGYPAEIFDLLRVEVEAPIGTEKVKCWFYIAHFSPHRQTPHIHEVLGPKLPVEVGSRCRVHINRSCGQLPHASYPTLLIV
jgi:hypothetical protein